MTLEKKFINIKDKTGVVERYGKIAIEIFHHSFRLRWSYLDKARGITIKGGITLETFKIACGKAQLINVDLALDRYDDSLVKYNAVVTRKESRVG